MSTLFFVLPLLIIYFFFLLLPYSTDNYTSYMTKLRNDLLNTRKYDKYARPVKDHNQSTNVTLLLLVNQFVDLVCILVQSKTKLNSKYSLFQFVFAGRYNGNS